MILLIDMKLQRVGHVKEVERRSEFINRKGTYTLLINNIMTLVRYRGKRSLTLGLILSDQNLK